MNKKSALVLLALLILPALLVMQACSPEAKPLLPRPLSFSSVTYTNPAPAFSIKYPKDWITKPTGALSVLNAAAKDERGADAFSIAVVDETDDPASAVKNGLEGMDVLKQSGATVSIKAVKPIMLADGKTEGVEAVLTTKIDTYDIWIYCYAFNTSGKTVIFIGNTLAGETSKALIREIAHTLAPK
jgi:hypothetical protein